MSKPWDDITKSIHARSTLINWPQQIQNIIDQYKNKDATIPNGIQKDAIQNSWDARVSRKHGKGWGIHFAMATGRKPQWFSFTDWGTYGLTGKVLTGEELAVEHLPPEERWGRFENLAFTKTDEPSALGARGQGKFIFVAGSESHRIIYDSLRIDGTYRLGVRWVEKTDCKVMHYDDDDGRRRLSELVPDLLPLKATGTRVIIIDPSADLVKAVRDGTFAQFIIMTWWEILRNHKASIDLDSGDGAGVRHLTSPNEMDIPGTDDTDHFVLVKEHVPIKVDRTQVYVAKLHVCAHKTRSVPDDIRGIALQRGGMRIMNYRVPHLPDDVSNRLYGYCRFEEPLEDLMKELEDTTHFDFNLRRGAGRRLKELLDKEVSTFAEKKLGAPSAPSAEAANQEAARRAVMELNRFAKTLGISLGGKGAVGGEGGLGSSSPIHVSFLGGLKFPREGTSRVNYGEAITAEKACLVNKSAISIEVRVRVFLVHKKTTAEQVILDERCELGPNDLLDLLSPFRLDIGEAFEKGEWLLRHRVVALRSLSLPKFEFRKGDIINEFGNRFWVEEDPPESGVFEDVKPVEFQPPDHELQHRVRPGSTPRRRKLEYNTVHDAYRSIRSDAQRVEEYVFERAACALIEVDVEQDTPKLIVAPETLAPADLIRKAGEQVAKLLHLYYG